MNRPDVWFFYGFLATFTLSVRKVIYFYPINDQFNEWTGVYLYLSDIFLALTLVFWLKFIIQHNICKLSILIVLNWLKKAYVNLPLFLVLLSFVSVLWSENQAIALFRSFKLLEMAWLYFYVCYSFSFFSCSQTSGEQNNYTSDSSKMFRVEQDHRSPANLYEKCLKKAIFTFGLIFLIGLIQAIIAIIQFLIQHSIGLIWLKESILSPEMGGVAKIEFGGQKIIRAYGLMPHPNILGGFLVLSLLLHLIFKFYFNIHKATRDQDDHKSFMWNILSSNIFMNLSVLVQIIALILTFSKSAFMGLVFSLSYLLFRSRGKQILLFHVKQLFLILLICLLLAFLGFYLFNLDFDLFLNQGILLRKAQIDVSRETMLNGSFLGYGMGQYVNQLSIVTRGTLEYWQYQPVHNVFLLILSELGFVGIFAFVWFLWKLFHSTKNVPRETSCLASVEQNKKHSPLQEDSCSDIFMAMLLGLIFIMLFDHYFWDIQQGQIMLWMVLGLISGTGVIKSEK